MADTANDKISPDLTGLFSLTGKVALVTGGARGLGKMIAAGLLRAGAKVYITSRKEEDVRAAAAELNALGMCQALPGDAGSPQGIANWRRFFAKRAKKRSISWSTMQAGHGVHRSKPFPTRHGPE